MTRIVKLALLVTLVSSSYTIVCAQSLPTTVVAYTGQAVSGVSGETHGTLSAFPRIGPNGHVAFSSVFAGPPDPDDFVYFVGLPGDLDIAIREDADAGGPELFDGNGNVGVDANGKISVWTSLAFPTPSNQRQVLYGQMPGGSEIARQGTTVAPGFAGGLFSVVNAGQATNDDGEVAFGGLVSGGDATAASDFGLFAGSAGDLKLVAREGSAAPGATGTTPVFSTFFDRRINTSGQVGFAAGLTGAGVTTANDRTIYVWTPSEGGAGTLALAAQTGSPAPGTPVNVNFSQVDDIPSFNDSGEVAFRGQLIGDGVITSNNSGIWAGAPGDVQLVMRAGDPSPLAGITFRSPQPGPRINDNGDVAFYSNISGTGVGSSNDTAIWTSTSEGIQLVAREGMQAPGTAAGTIFGLTDTLLAFNDLGQVAFTSPISGGGSSAANNRGLWAGTPGDLHLIAREGDVIDLDPGPGELLKTISGNNGISFGFGMNNPFSNDSANAAFNDAGQIAWRATFTDATFAILLSELPGVDPDPDADFDDDGDIDGRDFLIWQRGFGLTGQNDNTLGDADFSGTIDGADLVVWQDQYGTTPPVTATVPEPAGILLLLPGVFAICARRCGIKP